jgi:KDO2-lipid IV(A) lauroyltransferase
VSRVPRRENLSEWGYAAGWRMVRAMPDTLARNIFDAGARYAARGGGPCRPRTREEGAREDEGAVAVGAPRLVAAQLAQIEGMDSVQVMQELQQRRAL